MTLFHGSSSRFLRAILRDGIQPRGVTGRSTYDGLLESHVDCVYLTDVYPLHFGLIAVDRHGGNLLVAASNVDDALLEPDTDFSVEGQHSLKFDDAIECLGETGCVCVRGVVVPTLVWVLDKRQTEKCREYCTRIRTGVQHRAFYESHADNRSAFLMHAKRYRRVGDEWTTE